MHIYTYTYKILYVYIYIYIRTHTNTHTHIHTHTHTNTYSDRARISDFRYGGVSVGGQHARQCTKPVALHVLSASVSSPLPLRPS